MQPHLRLPLDSTIQELSKSNKKKRKKKKFRNWKKNYLDIQKLKTSFSTVLPSIVCCSNFQGELLPTSCPNQLSAKQKKNAKRENKKKHISPHKIKIPTN